MTNEIADAIAKAATGLAPTEYCLRLGFQHWSTCMSKTEWAAWAQAVFSGFAIFAAYRIGRRQIRIEAGRDAQAAAIATVIVRSVVDETKAAYTTVDITRDAWSLVSEGGVHHNYTGFAYDISLLRSITLPSEQECLQVAPSSPDASRMLLNAIEAHRDVLRWLDAFDELEPSEEWLVRATAELGFLRQYLRAAIDRLDPTWRTAKM